MDRAFDDLQTLRQTVAEAHGDAAGGYTDELLQFGDIERVVGGLQQVITTDRQHNLLLLVDDMRREHERVFEPRSIDELQYDVIGMPVQFVGVMYLDKLNGMRIGRVCCLALPD